MEETANVSTQNSTKAGFIPWADLWARSAIVPSLESVRVFAIELRFYTSDYADSATIASSLVTKAWLKLVRTLKLICSRYLNPASFDHCALGVV